MGFISNSDGTVTDEHTGDRFANASIASSLGYGGGAATATVVAQAPINIPASASSPGGSDTRARDASGNLTTNQTQSSQYWMNAGYTGPEPDLQTKANYSDAQYAHNNAVAIAEAAVAANGAANVNPAIVNLANSPAPGGTAVLAVPYVAPVRAAAAAPGSGSPAAAGPAAPAAPANYGLPNFSGITDLISKNLIWIVLIIVAAIVLPGLLSGSGNNAPRYSSRRS